jgi:A1 cistron-splicing factor AAR2
VILKEVLDKMGNPKDILGELQYCFITFLLGENLEAFEQWKSLVSIICSCPSGMQ